MSAAGAQSSGALSMDESRRGEAEGVSDRSSDSKSPTGSKSPSGSLSPMSDLNIVYPEGNRERKMRGGPPRPVPVEDRPKPSKQRKLPIEAMYYYVALGPKRSLRKVAQRFGVKESLVQKYALRERWIDEARILDQEAEAVGVSTRLDLTEMIRDMEERHLAVIAAIQSKVEQKLRGVVGFKDAMDAVRAWEIAVKQERLLLGEPTERTEVRKMIQEETTRWLEVVDVSDEQGPVLSGPRLQAPSGSGSGASVEGVEEDPGVRGEVGEDEVRGDGGVGVGDGVREGWVEGVGGGSDLRPGGQGLQGDPCDGSGEADEEDSEDL